MCVREKILGGVENVSERKNELGNGYNFARREEVSTIIVYLLQTRSG